MFGKKAKRIENLEVELTTMYEVLHSQDELITTLSYIIDKYKYHITRHKEALNSYKNFVDNLNPSLTAKFQHPDTTDLEEGNKEGLWTQ